MNAAPNRVCLVYQGKEWTYLDVKLLAQRYGNYFLSLGIKSRGSYLVIFVANSKTMLLWILRINQSLYLFGWAYCR